MKTVKLVGKKLFLIVLSGFIIITISGCTNPDLPEENDNYPVENPDNSIGGESSNVTNSGDDQSDDKDTSNSENLENEEVGNDSLEEYSQ